MTAWIGRTSSSPGESLPLRQISNFCDISISEVHFRGVWVTCLFSVCVRLAPQFIAGLAELAHHSLVRLPLMRSWREVFVKLADSPTARQELIRLHQSMGPADMADERGRRYSGEEWLALIIIVVAICLWVFTFFRTESWAGRAIVFGVGCVTALVSALVARPFIKELFAKRQQSNIAPLVNISQALVAGLLAGWAAFAVIPEGAIARIAETLEEMTDGQDVLIESQRTIIERLPAAPPATPPVRTSLPGYWGDEGCDIVWRFEVTENALTAEIVQTLPDLPSYRLIASIVAAEGYRLEAIGEEPVEARGMAATFTIDTSGAIQRLSWADRVRTVPLILVPCPEPIR